MKTAMKKWMSLLLALLMVLGLGTTALAAEGENPVGAMSGNTYFNDSLGITMALPSNWHFLSDAELASQMGYDSQYASRKGLSTLLERDSLVCAMYAAATDDPAWNASLMVQDLGIYRSLDEQTFFDLAKNSLTDSLTAQGYTNLQMTPATFLLAGTEHVGADLTGNMGLLQVHLILVLLKGERYMGSLTVAALTKEKAEEVLAFCAPLSDDNRPAVDAGSDAKATYDKAKEAMENKLYYTAYQLFTQIKDYEDAASLAAQCQRPMPKSKQVSRNSAYNRKTIRLNLTNKLKNGYNIYVRIYDSTGNTFVASVFIHSGKTSVVWLPDDTFLFKAAYGKGAWYGEEEMFGDDAIYKKLFSQSFRQVGRYGYYYFTFKDELDYTTIKRTDF